MEIFKMNIEKENWKKIKNQEEVKNYYSCYGESDARCIREEDRKRRWLSHKSKNLDLYYTTATKSFKHKPNWGILDYALTISDDKEFTKEILEVGILKQTLMIERLTDDIEREFPKIEKIVSELGNVRTPSGGVITEHRGAELLLFNYERLNKKEDITTLGRTESPFFDTSLNSLTLMGRLNNYSTSKSELQKWITALDVHETKVAKS